MTYMSHTFVTMVPIVFGFPWWNLYHVRVGCLGSRGLILAGRERVKLGVPCLDAACTVGLN